MSELLCRILLEYEMDLCEFNWTEYISKSGWKHKLGSHLLRREHLGNALELIFDSKVNRFELLRLIKNQELQQEFFARTGGICAIEFYQYELEPTLIKVQARKNYAYFDLNTLETHLKKFGSIVCYAWNRRRNQYRNYICNF